MTRRDTLKLVLAAVAIAAGLLASLLPNQWIEQVIGIEPDGGSGLFELLFVAAPIAAGVVLAAQALLAERRLRWQPGKAGEGPAKRP
jgi:hypothetical protein